MNLHEMTKSQNPLPLKLMPFDVCIEGGELAVRDALSRVLEGLGPLDLDVEEAGTVELVLAEALNNIVEHAYAPVAGEGPIRIHCVHEADGLHLRIQDEGIAMPDGKTPLGMIAPMGDDLMDLPEGGFGWFLIQDLARDVRYERIGNENALSLRLAIGLHPIN